jgi:prepilin-type N-terminal cleavage/methylation domain-containing protein
MTEGGPAPLVARPGVSGFTLTEILVVMGLLAVLLLATLPNLGVPDAVPTAQAARQVAADMGLARRLAIADHVNYLVTFAPAAGPYSSYTVAPQGGPPGPDFPKPLPAGVVITGTQQVTFAPSGATTAPAALSFAKGAAAAQVQVAAATGYVQETGP